MAISYTKNSWTDAANSGTAITAAKLNNYENVISSLVTEVNSLRTQVNALKADSGLKYLIGNSTSDYKIAYRKIGIFVYVVIENYAGISIAGGKRTETTQALPNGYRPKVSAWMCCNGIGQDPGDTACYIKNDGKVSYYFQSTCNYFFAWCVFPV